MDFRPMELQTQPVELQTQPVELQPSNLPQPMQLQPTDFQLQPVELELRRQPGPLLAQIQAALAAHGRPLRWAITAVEPNPAGGATGSLLRIEALVRR
jgi:hypothetical protein